MKYSCALIAVRDMEASKAFYKEVLGQKISMDLGANVAFNGGFALQRLDMWAEFLDTEPQEIRLGGKDAELYFETEDIDGFMVQNPNLELVHDLKEHDWGQRVVRFYDPDGHIIEVGEDMRVVVKRFAENGMSVADMARKTMFTPKHIEGLLKK